MKQKPKADTKEGVPVKVGDAVSFYVDEVLTKGIAMAVYREGTQWFVKVCPVRAVSLPFLGLGGFFFKKKLCSGGTLKRSGRNV